MTNIQVLFSAFRKGAKRDVTFASAAASVALGLCLLPAAPGIAGQQPESHMSVPAGRAALSTEIAGLERKVSETPSDADAWALIAPAYFRAGDFAKASEAFKKTIELSGENEDRLLGLAEALTAANNGEISQAAQKALTAAVAKNPKSDRGRLWLALAAEQDGKKAEAEKIYTEMLNENPVGTLKKIVTTRLANLYSPPAEAANLPGADGGKSLTTDSANPHGHGSGASAKNHEGGIPAMVDKLAQKLKENKGSPEQWLMLIRSYYVLNEKEKAEDTVSRAKHEFAGDAKVLEQIGSLVSEAASPDFKAAELAPGGRSIADPAAAIRDMVSGLTEKLKENKGDLEGWLKLIRSYAVLKEVDKAQEAASTARQQFAADANAVEQIDSLVREVKQTQSDKKEGAPKS